MIRSPSGLSRFPIVAPEVERGPPVKPGGGKGTPAPGSPKPPRPPRSKNRS